MADSRFFGLAGPFTLARLGELSGAEPGPGCDLQAVFTDVASLDAAGPSDLAFLDNRAYVDAFATSRAGACLVIPELAGRAPAGMALLLSAEPYRAYARIAAAFHPVPPLQAAIHDRAVVDPTAVLGPGCRVEAGAVIGARAEIGARCHIGANAVIGDGVVLGEDCVIGAGTTISHAMIGCRVNLYPGVRIGQDGFGFAMGPQGHLKVPQLGRVVIHDDVEIGANTTVDRGAGPDTVIGAGCKIDNLVQVGHNVQLGRGCVVVAQVGISGSTRIDDFAVIGGQAGIAGHLRIGAGARIAAQAGVMRNVAAGTTVVGSPAVDGRDYWRQVAALGKLARKTSG